MAVKFQNLNPYHVPFNHLTVLEASHVVYGKLLPACQSQGVLLTYEGNLADPKNRVKNPQAFPNFDISRIQEVFAKLEGIVKTSDEFELHTLAVKHQIEWGGFYATHGEVIVAMLLKGYAVSFGPANQSFYGNFNAALL